MIMDLFILRHGIAVEPGTAGYDDASRPLTSEGKEKLKSIAIAMLKLELSFDLILSSPYTRARQTAEIVAHRLKLSDKIEFSRSLIPNGNFSDLLQTIKGHETVKSILLVGHEPFLSELISLLVFGEAHSAVVMKKAGLAKLRVPTLKPGRCALLVWLMTPKQMTLLGG
jgi:phosphohistidine phosphatase